MKGTLKNKADSNKVEIAKQVEKLPPDNGIVKSAKTQMEFQTKKVENRQEVNKKSNVSSGPRDRITPLNKNNSLPVYN